MMKKKLFVFLVILTLALSLALPALASTGSVYVTDAAGILSETERQTLEDKAAGISAQYECGVYIYTVYDHTTYAPGAYDAAQRIYLDNDLGVGEYRDGAMLLLSMSQRDYALLTHGNAEFVFNASGWDAIEDAMLGRFAQDDWYGGFNSYLSAASALLKESGGVPDGPVKPTLGRVITSNLGLILGIPLAVAAIVCFILWRGMKSVAKKTSAREYISAGGVDIYNSSDQFTHSTQVRVRVKSDPPRSSGGGFSGGGGGGFSGRSGEF